MFPLQNAAQLTQLIERSSYGKVQATSGKAEVAALRNSWELYSGGFEVSLHFGNVLVTPKWYCAKTFY